MVFTYRVAGVPVLYEIGVHLDPGTCVLLTGVEDRNYMLLGGVLAGLFPVDARGAPPQVEELMKDFSGELDVREGELPSGPVYLGPDPEKHLLFSRVDEELVARTGGLKDIGSALEVFGLGARFLKRRISTLSGGEKMKLALTIAFSGGYGCMILHGVLPWLDGAGRDILRREIGRAAGRGAAILLLEQCVDELLPVAHRVLFFDGSKVLPYKKPHRISAYSRVRTLARGISKAQLIARGRAEPGVSATAGPAETERSRIVRSAQTVRSRTVRSDEVVRFDSVRFRYASREETDFSLRDVSFSLSGGRLYGLMGDNGSGKSTVAKLVLRAERAVQGRVYFLGRDICDYSRDELVERICYVGQFPEQQIILSSVDEYRERAKESGNTLAGRLLGRRFQEGNPLPISVLSPLELKVLLLSSSVGAGTRLVILDEPTWGIDIEGQARVLETLLEILSEIGGAAVLVISHDLAFLNRLGAELFILENGCLRRFASKRLSGEDR